MLGHQRSEPYVRSGWLIDRRGCRRQTGEIVDRFDVRTVGVDVSAIGLSGGNQQKLVVGREMAADPKLLIAAQPTRGIDVGAQAAVWEQVAATTFPVLLLPDWILRRSLRRSSAGT